MRRPRRRSACGILGRGSWSRHIRGEAEWSQALLSFCMQATFLYEQQLQREQDTVLKCLQTLHMQLGVADNLSLEPVCSRVPCCLSRPQALLEGRITRMTLFSFGLFRLYFAAPVYLRESLSMWSSASLPFNCFATSPLIETYS
jgi:hypothetical protein